MVMSIEQIASEALRLNSHDRALLAETIWESLEDPYVIPCEISDDEALALAKTRYQESNQGAVEPLSHQELMTRLRK